MRSYNNIARFISIWLAVMLALASIRPAQPVAAQGGAVEIEKVTHYAGNTDVYTNKKEDLEESEADDCPGTNQESGSSATLTGVVTVALDTAKGQVRLTLPADIRAGDTISGTVDDESLGRSDVLNGTVFDVAGKQHQLRKRVLTFVVPTGAATLPIILRNSSGRELARSQAQVNQHGQQSIVPSRPGGDRPIVPPRPDNFPPTPLGNFQPPRIGQTGHELSIPGNFDGLAETTNVSIGNQPAEFLAESPRATFARVPDNAPAGPTTLTIEKARNVPGQTEPQTAREQFKFNTMSVDLEADKLHLRRGETTQLHVTVNGLSGLEDYQGRVQLKLENLSPDVMRFNSIPSQELLTTIYSGSQHQPTLNTSSGTFRLNEKLTGINAGTFTILAAVVQAQDDPEKNLTQDSDGVLEDLLKKLNAMKDWDYNNGGQFQDYFWKRVKRVMDEMKRRGYKFDEKNRQFERPPEYGEGGQKHPY